ncbi:hypothetical protein D3C79_625370 [compost metagenome]
MQTLNFHQGDRRAGQFRRFQPIAHIAVVLGRDRAERLVADKTVGDAQRGRQVLPKDLQIDFGITVIGNTLIFNEITRESGAGYDVLRSFVYLQVGDIGSARQHQPPPILIAETRGVFFHQKQVQPVAFRRRLAHQILMAAGKRIGIHHDAADALAWPPLARQLGRVAFQAAWAVFHQHHDARHAGYRIETALAEQRLILQFGVDKQLGVMTFIGQVHQFGRQRQRQPFATHLRADGDAFDNILCNAAAGDQLIVLGHGNKNLYRSINIQIVTAQKSINLRNVFMI